MLEAHQLQQCLQKMQLMQIRLEKGKNVYRLASEVELAAYRIVQEALNNAIQHAQAKHIVVRVQCEAKELILAVTDDGSGFTLPQRPDLLTQAGHFGLMGMQERAILLGGTLQVHTASGQGTKIVARLPAQPNSE